MADAGFKGDDSEDEFPPVKDLLEYRPSTKPGIESALERLPDTPDSHQPQLSFTASRLGSETPGSKSACGLPCWMQPSTRGTSAASTACVPKVPSMETKKGRQRAINTVYGNQIPKVASAVTLAHPQLRTQMREKSLDSVGARRKCGARFDMVYPTSRDACAKAEGFPMSDTDSSVSSSAEGVVATRKRAGRREPISSLEPADTEATLSEEAEDKQYHHCINTAGCAPAPLKPSECVIASRCREGPFDSLRTAHSGAYRFCPSCKQSRSSESLNVPAAAQLPPSNSPKSKPRIPSPGHRLSADHFWSQSAINEWNDQYSPRKVLRSPRKPRKGLVVGNSDKAGSPSGSQRPTESTTPVRRTREALETKRAFEARRDELAREFLRELDATITSGRVGKLAASCGGIKVVWSRKLNSTAGRATWRRESVRENAGDESMTVRYNHHACIELAEKVIDNEERLLNVIAHEFCHLANFMISGVRGSPHGKEFKEWARKCSVAFGHRGVEVTTKHSYDIDYKYIWTCTACGGDYKRHSKSINPAKHCCGSCKSKLVQTKPAVRANHSEYQLFVREQYPRIKERHPGATLAEVMGMVGKRYRELKHGPKHGDTDNDGGITQLAEMMKIAALDERNAETANASIYLRQASERAYERQKL